MLSFKLPRAEHNLVDQIVRRAKSELGSHLADVLELEMDLIACHNGGCTLNFEKLLNAPIADFVHDIVGIQNHINRLTGCMEDRFSPRCSK